MSNQIEPVLSFQDVVQAFQRQGRKGGLVFVSVIIVSGLVLCLWPRQYRSEGKLFVTLGRQSVALDPTATTGQVVAVSESREIQINSIIEMLGSRAMAEKVTRRVGADVIHGRTPLPDPSMQRAETPTSTAVRPTPAFEAAVTRVEKSLSVSAPRMSTVVSIECTERSPELAQRIVETLMDEYLAEHVRVHRTAGSKDFFDEQSQFLKQELEQATKALCHARNELGIASIASKKQTLETHIAATEQQITGTETALAAARSKVIALEERMNSLPRRIVTQRVTGVTDLGADSSQSQLFQLQIQELQLLSRFKPAHPKVAAVRQQLARAKQLQRELEPAPGQSTTAVNPAHQQLEIAKLQEQAQIEALLSQSEELRQQLEQMHSQLRELNLAEIQIDELERTVDIANVTFSGYLDKFEQARIDEEMQRDRISNVNIMQAANLVANPVSPSKALVVLAGLVAASLGAYATVMIAELLGSSPNRRQASGPSPHSPVLVADPPVQQLAWNGCSSIP